MLDRRRAPLDRPASFTVVLARFHSFTFFGGVLIFFSVVKAFCDSGGVTGRSFQVSNLKMRGTDLDRVWTPFSPSLNSGLRIGENDNFLFNPGRFSFDGS